MPLLRRSFLASLFATLVSLPVAACGQVPALGRTPADSAPPPIPRELRAAWVASVSNIDWPSRPGLSTAQQQASSA
jgi:hypothetical protein